MESKNITKIDKQTKRQICCFLLFTIFLIILCLSPYYFIYNKELEEKRTIDQLIEITSEDANLRNEESQNNVSCYDILSFTTRQSKSDNMLASKPSNGSSETNRKSSPKTDAKWIGDCILMIPDINLTKIVYTGKNREKHLENYELITANDTMKYQNGGNYIICGHASRLYGHSLNRLKEVKKGTIIQIQTKDKMDEYIVNQITYENMNQTNQYCNQTQENTLTIISCAKYISDDSYIVVHAKLK